MRVFNPHTPTNRGSNLAATYRKQERLKKNAYAQGVIEVEHASFTPLVFSVTGGLGNEANKFYKRLASLLAAKQNEPYSSTLACLRCRLSFSLLWSSIRCIKGVRCNVVLLSIVFILYLCLCTCTSKKRK